MRRTRPSLFARLRSFWLVWMLLGALLAAGCYQLALWPGFHLQQITVSGEAIVPPNEIIRRAALDRSRNIWLQNTRAAAARVELIPWIATAHVHRVLPASVFIDVTEREVGGCVVTADGSRFIIDADSDADARVLEEGCTRTTAALFRLPQMHSAPAPGVFIHRSELAQLRRDAVTLASLAPGVFASFYLNGFGELVATMEGGVAVKFGGDADLNTKVPLLESILKSSSVRVRDLRAVDLRAPQAPVVEYR